MDCADMRGLRTPPVRRYDFAMPVAAQQPTESFDDAATDIPIALKGSLVDENGVRYRDFRSTLTPRYRRVWRDIAAGYAFLVGVPITIAIWDPHGGLAV